jgi:hypothetical protein
LQLLSRQTQTRSVPQCLDKVLSNSTAHNGAGQASGQQQTVLAALPRASADAAAAAVAVAAAHAHLAEVQRAAASLQSDAADAAAQLPHCTAMAEASAQAAANRSRTTLKVLARSRALGYCGLAHLLF